MGQVAIGGRLVIGCGDALHAAVPADLREVAIGGRLVIGCGHAACWTGELRA